MTTTLKKSLAILLSLIMVFSCTLVAFAVNIDTPYDDSQYYTQGDYSIHYRVVEAQGEKKGQIMFVHGFIYSGSTWNGMAEIMAAEGYDCYLVDLPNYGYSTRENADTELIDREELVVNLMETVAPLNEWILAGHSMGGGVSMNIACDHPELKALMLFCPSEINFAGGNSMSGLFNPSNFLMKIMTSLMNAVLRSKLIVKLAVLAVTGDIRYALKYDTDILTAPLLIEGTIPGIFFSSSNARSTDLEAIGNIQTPTMLVWADKDSVINSEMTENITNALTNAWVANVEGSHIVIETNPEEMAKLSLGFLTSCAWSQKSVAVDIFESADNFYTPGIQYGRILELQHNGNMNGTLLATCEKQGIDNGMDGLSFPIFRSTDGGDTWERISDVTTDRLGGMRWEPTFFEFDRDVGAIKEGTILCAGLAIVPDGDAWKDGVLMVFKSTDCGLTWEYMSDIAEGEREPYGIWEPFFILDDSDRLICYYSDCRDYDNHSQKIVYQISEDGGYTWGEVVDVISLNDRNMRPGMPVVARMGDGRYIMTYEMVLENNPGSGNQVHYRFSDDGLNWGDPTDKGIKLVTGDGVVPGSSPYVVYTPSGGENGMLLVTACFQTPGSRNGSDLFVNYNYGEGEWVRMKNPLPYSVGGYSHGACVSADGTKIYLVSGVDYSSNSTGPLAKLAFSYLQLAETA